MHRTKLTIVLAGAVVLSVLFFSQFTAAQQANKCGDGICDEFEEADSTLCTRDCQGRQECVQEGKDLGPVYPGNTRQCCDGLTPYIPPGRVGTRGICAKSSLVPVPKLKEQISKDSPFGASGAFSRPYVKDDAVNREEILRMVSGLKEPYSHVQDIGSKWIRPGIDITWPLVQPTPDHVEKGVYEWAVVDNLYGRVPPGVNALANICVGQGTKPGTWKFVNKYVEERYLQYVKAIVERYDGDGLNDMPGLKNPIKYWQIENEPAFPNLDSSTFNLDWIGFSHIVEITYTAIKESDREAKISLGGVAGGHAVKKNDPFFQKEIEGFYFPLLQNLRGRYIDIFDIHYYEEPREGPEQWKRAWKDMKTAYQLFRRQLDQNGYQKTKIWFTETAIPSKPVGERAQASDLVKRFIHPLTIGVKKIFWSKMIEGEYPLNVDQISSHFGLVYDGIGQGDPGYGVKKLAYYTYKKMVEVLEGSDWKNIKTIKEEQNDAYGLFLYKVTRNGKPVYVGWFDCFDEQKCSVMRIDLRAELAFDRDVKTVKITEAVPRYETGKEVVDYAAAFKSETKATDGGKITIALEETPVFVEGE